MIQYILDLFHNKNRWVPFCSSSKECWILLVSLGEQGGAFIGKPIISNLPTWKYQWDD
uniref:Uncharacterized protein n=1 Tax=Rhizophora mucronata TaxID=61149 RepID=A0A2P2N5G9_RHIMU